MEDIGSILAPGTSLGDGQTMSSPNYKLYFQEGFMFMVKNGDPIDRVVFTWGDRGHPGAMLKMTTDGDLQIIAKGYFRSSETAGNPGAYLIVTDGHASIIVPHGPVIWDNGQKFGHPALAFKSLQLTRDTLALAQKQLALTEEAFSLAMRFPRADRGGDDAFRFSPLEEASRKQPVAREAGLREQAGNGK